MSCLYSSPEVTSLKLIALKLLTWSLALRSVALNSRSRLAAIGARHVHRIAMLFNSTQILSYVAINKDAFPSSPAHVAGCTESFRLPKQAQVCRVSFQAQYQAFVRFAVKSSAALSAIALNWTCVLEPFNRGGLSFLRTLASTRNIPSEYLRGQQPWTDVMAGT